MIVQKSKTFTNRLDNLRDKRAKANIAFRIRRIEAENHFGDYKPVGDKVYELRIHSSPGYRVYFYYHNNEVIIGGDKGSQTRGIIKAKQMIRET